MSEALDARARLHEPFRSRRGRIVALIAAAGQGVALLITAVILPAGGPLPTAPIDRIGFLVVAALIGGFLVRCAQLSAIPSEQGLLVRNLLLSRQLDWAEIVGIRYGGGDPWVTLDLSDGDTLAVMAIQRADGERAAAQATRLATLIAVHSPR